MKLPPVIHGLERAILILIATLTVVAVVLEVKAVWLDLSVSLADLLLLFLYAEILAMVSAFYSSRRLEVAYPIFIAMTALARLIVLQGKDMAPENILYEAGSILVLTVSVWLLSFLEPPTRVELSRKDKESDKTVNKN